MLLNYIKSNIGIIMINFCYTFFILILLTTIISTVIGVLLGIISSKKKTAGRIILSICNIIQTIPSLVMFLVLLLLGTGVGLKPAVIAITLYNILPIVINTNTGISSVNPVTAKVLGMNKFQSLIYVEIPMASPMILTGIKLALISASSCAVLGAIIGAPGLGYYIYSGIAQMRYQLCIIGAVPTTLISLGLDVGMSKLIKLLSNRMKVGV